VVIEPRRKRLGFVSILSPTRHGDERYGSTQGTLAHSASNLIAGQFRHANVQEGHFRLDRGKGS
jgi:hypothetical protein